MILFACKTSQSCLSDSKLTITHTHETKNAREYSFFIEKHSETQQNEMHQRQSGQHFSKESEIEEEKTRRNE